MSLPTCHVLISPACTLFSVFYSSVAFPMKTMVSSSSASCDRHWSADIHALLIYRFCARSTLRDDAANPTATWSSLSAWPYMLVAKRKVSSNDLAHYPKSRTYARRQVPSPHNMKAIYTVPKSIRPSPLHLFLEVSIVRYNIP